MFQSTPPCGGATKRLIPSQRTPICFNPRPRVGGRPSVNANGLRVAFVSIHAPVWGGDNHSTNLLLCFLRVSIHAPVWGATLFGLEGVARWWFQSTPPCGGRRLPHVVGHSSILVSIHAPVWGATQQRQGGRIRDYVSIHAPVWGATHMHGIPNGIFKVSIHAPVWGATGIGSGLGRAGIRFNPRPRVGGDPVILPVLELHSGFNPRPRVGGDCGRWSLVTARRLGRVAANLSRCAPVSGPVR